MLIMLLEGLHIALGARTVCLHCLLSWLYTANDADDGCIMDNERPDPKLFYGDNIDLRKHYHLT